jgi:hypothetical protein
LHTTFSKNDNAIQLAGANRCVFNTKQRLSGRDQLLPGGPGTKAAGGN